MNTWIILSWVLVAILTTVNILIFIKLRGAMKQMMSAAFPGNKNMGDMMAQAQKLMQAMGGAESPQMKQAMNMFQQMQKGKK